MEIEDLTYEQKEQVIKLIENHPLTIEEAIKVIVGDK